MLSPTLPVVYDVWRETSICFLFKLLDLIISQGENICGLFHSFLISTFTSSLRNKRSLCGYMAGRDSGRRCNLIHVSVLDLTEYLASDWFSPNAHVWTLQKMYSAISQLFFILMFCNFSTVSMKHTVNEHAIYVLLKLHQLIHFQPRQNN